MRVMLPKQRHFEPKVVVDPAALAAASPRFLAWRPYRGKSVGAAAFGEKHYSPHELGALWGLHPNTIREIFENEPDVLIVGAVNGTRRKRRYRTFRIPESVAIRVHRKLSTRA